MKRFLGSLVCGLWLGAVGLLSLGAGGCGGSPDEATIKASGGTTKTTPSGDTAPGDDSGEAVIPPSGEATAGATGGTTGPSAFDLVLHYPTADQTGVDVSTALVLNFSAPIDKTSLSSAFHLAPSGGGAEVAFTVSPFVGPDGEVPSAAMITLSAPLTPMTAYTASVTTAAKAVDASPLAADRSFSFTTGAAPTSDKPEVMTVSPADGSTSATSFNLLITFSEAIDFDHFKNTAEYLNTTPVAYFTTTLVAGTQNKVVLVSFDPPLKANTSYTIKIDKDAVKDMTGNLMEADYSWSFKTKVCGSGKGQIPCVEECGAGKGKKPCPDETLQVNYSAIVNNTTIEVNFNRAMNYQFMKNNGSVRLYNIGTIIPVPLDGTLNQVNDSTYRFVTSQPMKDVDTPYTVIVIGMDSSIITNANDRYKYAARSADGKAMAHGYSKNYECGSGKGKIPCAE
jgi:hypothetical protein